MIASTMSRTGRVATAMSALAAVGLGAAAVRGVFLGYPGERIAKSAFLSKKEQAILAALADAFFPPGGAIPLSGTDAGLVEYFDDYARQFPPGQGRLVHLLLAFLEHAPWAERLGEGPRFDKRHLQLRRRPARKNPAARADTVGA